MIMILLMVTAAAIPIMAPALENRRMREAARLASSFISGARSKAIQSGREVGVVLQRFEGRPYTMTLSYVEVPPPYGGDLIGSTCTVTLMNKADSPSLGSAYTDYTIRADFGAGAFTATLVQLGDTISFGYQGHSFTIIGPDMSPADGVLDQTATYVDAVYTGATPTGIGGALINPPADRPAPMPWTASASPPVPFLILRQPRRTSDQPLTLPDGMVIDLMQSGIGLNNSTQFTSGVSALFDPIVTFTPGGSVGHVVTDQSQRATAPIFLLLGRRELMPDVTQSGQDENFFDPATVNPKNLYLQNFWLTIGSQTGLVTTSEVTLHHEPFVDANGNGIYDGGESYTDLNGNGTFDTMSLALTRSIAVTAQSIGGR